MSLRAASRLAWALWAVGVAGCLAYVALETIAGSRDIPGTWFNGQEALGALAFPTVGAIVASRRSGNRLVGETMQPAHASLWLRSVEAAR